MTFEYVVDTFVPTVKGCGAEDKGWDPERCAQYQKFLNSYASKGWRLHKADYREVKSAGGCGTTSGAWLVCVFEKQA